MNLSVGHSSVERASIFASPRSKDFEKNGINELPDLCKCEVERKYASTNGEPNEANSEETGAED